MSSRIATRQLKSGRAILFLAAAFVAGAVLTAAASPGPRNGSKVAQSSGQSTTTIIPPNDPALHFIGHWDLSHADQAVTVNSGSRILCEFSGSSMSGLFGTEGITSPAQIWVRIDGQKPVRYTVDSASIDFSPSGLAAGRHTFELAVKDVDERVNRWIPPLAAGLIFKGLALSSGGKLLKSPMPGKLRMEFYGDSITQGVRIDNMAIGPDGSDGTKDYAFLVALAFGALHNQVGFGRQGIVRTGNGNVPIASQSFGLNFEGSPADPGFVPQVMVVNQGTNDQQYPSAQFEPAYRDYTAQLHRRNQKATIFCLRPFGGFHADDIQQAVKDLGEPNVLYVDTTGWLDKTDYTDDVHPNAGGQIKAAEQLVKVIQQKAGLKPHRTVESVAAEWNGK
jgi:lysophospholipase L1-like esterase